MVDPSQMQGGAPGGPGGGGGMPGGPPGGGAPDPALAMAMLQKLSRRKHTTKGKHKTAKRKRK